MASESGGQGLRASLKLQCRPHLRPQSKCLGMTAFLWMSCLRWLLWWAPLHHTSPEPTGAPLAAGPPPRYDAANCKAVQARLPCLASVIYMTTRSTSPDKRRWPSESEAPAAGHAMRVDAVYAPLLLSTARCDAMGRSERLLASGQAWQRRAQ